MLRLPQLLSKIPPTSTIWCRHASLFQHPSHELTLKFPALSYNGPLEKRFSSSPHLRNFYRTNCTSTSPQDTQLDSSLLTAANLQTSIEKLVEDVIIANGIGSASQRRAALLATPPQVAYNSTNGSLTLNLPLSITVNEAKTGISKTGISKTGISKTGISKSVDWRIESDRQVSSQVSLEQNDLSQVITDVANSFRLPMEFRLNGICEIIKPKNLNPVEGQANDFGFTLPLGNRLNAVVPGHVKQQTMLLNVDDKDDYKPSSFSIPSLLPPHRSLMKSFTFGLNFILNYRFYMIYMARTTFQAVRPLLAFCVFGEVMKLALAVMGSGAFIFFFSFILAFEVFYFFLQCYISYVFLGMFFTAAF